MSLDSRITKFPKFLKFLKFPKFPNFSDKQSGEGAPYPNKFVVRVVLICRRLRY